MALNSGRYFLSARKGIFRQLATATATAQQEQPSAAGEKLKPIREAHKTSFDKEKKYAGSYLKEVLDGMKSANVAVILSEASKSLQRIAGISSGGVSFGDKVHPSLADSAKLVSESIELFGAGVEGLLVKYVKRIIDEQYLLNRLAEAAFDIYGMVAILSRATRSISQAAPSSDHERFIIQDYYSRVPTRKYTMCNVISSQRRYLHCTSVLSDEKNSANSTLHFVRTIEKHYGDARQTGEAVASYVIEKEKNIQNSFKEEMKRMHDEQGKIGERLDKAGERHDKLLLHLDRKTDMLFYFIMGSLALAFLKFLLLDVFSVLKKDDRRDV